MNGRILSLIVFLLSGGLLAQSCYTFTTLPGESNPTDLNVIFITWDGVRWQEFFHGTDPLQPEVVRREPLFTRFWSEVAPRGVVYGNREAGHPVAEVSNDVFISLPAYMSMFAGHRMNCLMNDCSRIQSETVIDRMVDELGLTPREVAGFASWRQIALAFTRRDGIMTSNVSVQSLDDGSDDPELAELNRLQATDLPPWNRGPKNCGGIAGDEPAGPDSIRPAHSARWDRYTWSQATRYLRTHRPRFLYIGLGDTDEYGHRDEYPQYLNAIRENDERLAELVRTLDSMGDYGARTAIVLTTDHGRGSVSQWGWHGTPALPGARRVFAYIMPPRSGSARFEVLPAETTAFRHSDLRPTIEALLGVGQRDCSGCGQALVTRLSDEMGAVSSFISRAFAWLRASTQRHPAQVPGEERLALRLGNPSPEVTARALDRARQLGNPADSARLQDAILRFPTLRRYLDLTFAIHTGYPDRYALCLGGYPLNELELEVCASTTTLLASLAITAKYRWDLINTRRATGRGSQLSLGPGVGYRHLEWCGGGACAPSDGFDVLLSLQFTQWLAQHLGITLELDLGVGFQWIEEFAGFRDPMVLPEARATVGLSF